MAENLEHIIIRIWKSNEAIRAEFKKFSYFIAFMEHDSKGREKVLKEYPE